MTADMKTGVVIGLIIGAIAGGWYQQAKAASKLDAQLKDGIMFCHSMLHPGDDMLKWMQNESADLKIQHEFATCGWVGDTFQ